MTLHAAIEKLLKEKGKPLSSHDIAMELNKNKWYQKGNRSIDPSTINSSQISARVSKYPELFTRVDKLIALNK